MAHSLPPSLEDKTPLILLSVLLLSCAYLLKTAPARQRWGKRALSALGESITRARRTVGRLPTRRPRSVAVQADAQAATAGSRKKESSVEDLKTVLDPRTCVQRGKCVVQPEESKSASHEIYYELHGSGPRRALLIMGLGNSSLSYASTVKHFARAPPSTTPESDPTEFEASGRASPVPSNASSETLVDAPLDTATHQILVVDNRGVGHSDCPSGLYTTKGMARDAREVMRFVGWLEEDEEGKGEMGEGKVDIVGVSLGGMIAMELAALVPHRVSSLTLGVTTPGHGFIGNLPPWSGLAATIRLVGISDKRRRMKEIIDMCFPAKWLARECDMEVEGVDVRGKTNEDVMFELFEWRIRNQPPQSVAANMAQSAAAMTHYISRDELKRLNETIPKICILTGDEDALVDPRNSQILHELMPRSELIVWKDTGHAINIQRPDEFNSLLERVWEEGRSAPNVALKGQELLEPLRWRSRSKECLL